MTISQINLPALGAVGIQTQVRFEYDSATATIASRSQLEQNATPISTVNPLPVSENRGAGALSAVPAGSTNGTPLGTRPASAGGVRLYLPPNTSVTYTIAAAQPTSAPAVTFETPVSNLAGNWDEPLSGQSLYVVATVGSPLWRWI